MRRAHLAAVALWGCLLIPRTFLAEDLTSSEELLTSEAVYYENTQTFYEVPQAQEQSWTVAEEAFPPAQAAGPEAAAPGSAGAVPAATATGTEQVLPGTAAGTAQAIPGTPAGAVPGVEAAAAADMAVGTASGSGGAAQTEAEVNSSPASDFGLPHHKNSKKDTEEYRISEGTYFIGENLPAGEYMAFALDGKGSLMRFGKDGKTTYRSFAYNSIITASPGEKLAAAGCFLLPINHVDSSELRTDGDGTFKIGMHIAKKTYTIIPAGEAEGSFEVYNSSDQVSPAQSGRVSSPVSVTVIDGQYLVLEQCRMDPAPEILEKQYTDSETVKKVLERLNECGYSCGTPDGKIGSMTLNAVKKFQEDKGLKVNGAINDDLLEELYYAWLDAKAVLASFSKEAFQVRFDAAADYFNQGGAEFRKWEEADQDGLFVKDGKSAFLVEPLKGMDRIRSVFFRSGDENFGKKDIQELSVLVYALDETFQDPEQAVNLVLRFLYDGSAATEKVLYNLLDLGDTPTVWMRSALS